MSSSTGPRTQARIRRVRSRRTGSPPGPARPHASPAPSPLTSSSLPPAAPRGTAARATPHADGSSPPHPQAPHALAQVRAAAPPGPAPSPPTVQSPPRLKPAKIPPNFNSRSLTSPLSVTSSTRSSSSFSRALTGRAKYSTPASRSRMELSRRFRSPARRMIAGVIGGTQPRSQNRSQILW